MAEQTANPCMIEALTALASGLTPIPIKTGGSKTPPFPWKKYQTTPPTAADITTWWSKNPEWGLGIICGQTSQNFEMIELEGRSAHLTKELQTIAIEAGESGLWETLTNGWVDKTPTGGIHYHYKSTNPIQGNLKLARNRNKEVLAETRGQGGLTVTAPTPGTCHPNGKAWQRITGGPQTCPTFTPQQIETIHDLFRLLDETPRIEAQPKKTNVIPLTKTGDWEGGERPGDAIEKQLSWDDILTPHGWKKVTRLRQGYAWRRPGKNTGISATTGQADDRNRLYVFSTSTIFDTEVAYTKFAAYTLLNHHGDWNAAAKDLLAKGIGKAPEAPKVTFDLTKPANPASGETTVTTAGTIQQLAPQTQPAASITQTLDYTDDAAALGLAANHQTKITYIPERSTWYCWNGHLWEPQPQGGGKVREYAKQYARTLPEENKQDHAYKKRLLSAAGITAILTQAQTIQNLTTPADQLDAYPTHLNTPTGIINLKTGTTQPPNPAAKHTKTTLCAPDPDAPAPMWETFLNQTFQNDPDLIGYIQNLIGYSATGVINDHILPFAFGNGANGKSVLFDTISQILKDYATTAPAGFLMAHRQTHETEIARLQGCRLIVCSEINPEDRFDEAKIKELTGGDRLTARYLYSNYFTFTPTHHLWIMGNHQPAVRTGGKAFWRRLKLIPFQNQIKPENKIPDLSNKLVEKEAPQILAWIIQGAKNYLTNGLKEPQKVTKASNEYENEENTLERFIQENIQTNVPGASVKNSELRARYETWCATNGERPMSVTMLGRELKSKGFTQNKIPGNGARIWEQILLKDPAPTEDPTDSWADLGGGK